MVTKPKRLQFPLEFKKTSKAARINNPSEVKRVLQNFQASRQLSINVGIAILFSFRNTPLPNKEARLYYGVHE